MVWEGRSREAPPYPDRATALRVTAPLGCGSGVWYGRKLAFGFAPNMNDNILYHALAPLSILRSALPPFPLVSSASFGSARSRRQGAKRRSEPLTARTDPESSKGEGKGGSCPLAQPPFFPVRQHHRVLNRAGTRTTASGESRNASPVNMT